MQREARQLTRKRKSTATWSQMIVVTHDQLMIDDHAPRRPSQKSYWLRYFDIVCSRLPQPLSSSTHSFYFTRSYTLGLILAMCSPDRTEVHEFSCYSFSS